MDPRTLDLFRCLQSGPYDEGGLRNIERLLGSQRRALRHAEDWDALGELVQLLESFASAAGGGKVTAAALGAAAEIAEQELRQVAWADSLRDRAVAERWRGGVLAATEDVWSEQIARAEHAVEIEATPSAVRELAALYVQRGSPGDREQAADLYCTLAEVVGYPDSHPLIEEALAQVPEHAAARALLERHQAQAAADPGRMSFPELTHPPGILEAAPGRTRTWPPPLPAAWQSAGAETAQPFSSVSPVMIGGPSKRTQVRDRSSAVVRWVAFGTLGLSAVAALALFVRTPKPTRAAGAAPALVQELPAPPPPAPKAPQPAPLPPPPSAAERAPAARETAVAKSAAVSAPSVRAVLDKVSVRGGSYGANVFNHALDAVYARLDQCYARALEQHRVKGRLTLGFTVKANGRVSKAKSLGGTIKDPALIRCSVDAVASARFPKPRKDTAKVKLPLQYRPS